MIDKEATKINSKKNLNDKTNKEKITILVELKEHVKQIESYIKLLKDIFNKESNVTRKQYINNEINNKLLNRGIESLEQAFEPIKSGINKLISEYKTTTSRKIQKMKSDISYILSKLVEYASYYKIQRNELKKLKLDITIQNNELRVLGENIKNSANNNNYIVKHIRSIVKNVTGSLAPELVSVLNIPNNE